MKKYIEKKFIEKIIKLFIPPILTPKKFNYYKNRILNYKKIKPYIKYEENFYKRHAFINKAISNFKDCKYLEIGVFDNDVFNSIPLKLNNKYGVDSEQGGNFRMTSDDFFKKFPELKFDVIFIDGLHEYEQCQRDCINSMNQLNTGGIIFFHDMLPKSYFEECVPRKQGDWKGDVWKVAVELCNSKNVDFKMINIDCGIGVLKLQDKFEYKKMPELKNQSFENFLNYYKELPLINSKQGLELFESFTVEVTKP